MRFEIQTRCGFMLNCKAAFQLFLAGIIGLLSACATLPVPTVRPPTAVPTVKLPTATPVLTDTPAPTFTTTPTTTTAPSATRAATSTASPTPITYDRSSRAILIEADVWGGSDAPSRDSHVPIFRLYGDGYVVFAGVSTLPSTGLDAMVRVGRLSDGEIQLLLTYLNQAGFFALKDSYEPRPKPADMPTAFISVYLNKLKTATVYAPNADSTPQVFTDAFTRIVRTVPADSQTYPVNDGFLQATEAGSVGNLLGRDGLVDWAGIGVKLSDAIEGITVSGNTFQQIARLRANKSASTLYREGDRVYLVRFEPNLPRVVHLTDVLNRILIAPREFDGRVFDIVGYYRGVNVYGEARGTPANRNDWVIADESGAMFVTGAAPQGADVWTVVRLRAAVVYNRNGTSYLEARRVDNISSGSSQIPSTMVPTASATPTSTATPSPSATPTLPPITSADAAVAMIQMRFPEYAKIQKASAGLIGASSDIKIFDRGEGWEIVFVDGWGDCMAGCINNRYIYFSASKNGRITKVGEYTRIYNATTNAHETSGVPMWGVPK
jgi:hypothetical protein